MAVDKLKNNKNAVKGDEPATSHINIRVTPTEKAKWVKASAGGKLSDWIRKSLNDAASDS
ncbi:hypothetical protein P8629_08540 [Hydrogenovibrio sp. 3SP14C1]|uniref:hypothetical protein n=1 Tax=Hydrogenovibrio sp. 3SP14C1 TaxID=3038774 RepID=UPI0024173839|nr:hypothetical protein [Hydrogenovibrio sp. 3SP14C1]MDG4813054.1 hypothetical protein [Hydrogenovibrio sp. 3SP14C1]